MTMIQFSITQRATITPLIVNIYHITRVTSKIFINIPILKLVAVIELADLTNPNKDRPNLTYEFLGVKRVWRWTKERMQEAYEKGLVIQTKPGAVPALKAILDEQEGNPVDSIWADIPPIQAQSCRASWLSNPKAISSA